jgi:hypothetical protein
MTLPLLGPMTLAGFEHKWYLLFLLVILGFVGLYIGAQLARRKRAAAVCQHGAAGKRRPATSEALAAPAGDPAVGLAAVAHRGDGRTDARGSDPPQPRGRDAGDRRVTVHARHRHLTQPDGGRAGRRQAVRGRTHAGHQPGPDRLRRHRDRPGVADNQPRGHQTWNRHSAKVPRIPTC